jgi:co-chaperonin GroES (HSP10)
MQIIPNKGYVLLKPVPKKTETSSGFLLVDSSAEAPKSAIAIAVANDINYAAGDELIYRPYATADFKLNDELHFLVHIDDILGMVTND